MQRLSERRADGKAERVSRAKKLIAEGRPLPLPEVAAVYLVEALFDVGPVVPVGMGAIALRSEHLEPWERERGIALQPWESLTLRRLSAEYLAMSQRADHPRCPAPWVENVAVRREEVAKKIDDAFQW